MICILAHFVDLDFKPDLDKTVIQTEYSTFY